jgi:hypothetical protein
MHPQASIEDSDDFQDLLAPKQPGTLEVHLHTPVMVCRYAAVAAAVAGSHEVCSGLMLCWMH